MGIKTDYMSTLGKRAIESKPRTRKQLLADEVVEYIGTGKLRYSQILKIIKENGEQCVREVLAEMKRELNPKSRVKYFIWLCNHYRTELKPTQQQKQ